MKRKINLIIYISLDYLILDKYKFKIRQESNKVLNYQESLQFLDPTTLKKCV